MVVVMTLVYCTKKLKNGQTRKYGPYGPYYYEYTWWYDHRQSRWETKSKYLGKNL